MTRIAHFYTFAIDKNAARVKAEFEHALLSCLLFNVLYMYYIDHRLIVLFIRMSQIVRLLYFPYESRASQRSTSLLLFMSNVPVLLIHGAVFAEGKVGDMLLINFIGPEPHVLAKLFYVDTVTIFLQSVLASVAAGDSSIVTSFPVLVNHQWHEPDNLVHSNEAEIVPSSRTRTEQLSASRDNGGSQEEHRSGSDDVTVNVL